MDVAALLDRSARAVARGGAGAARRSADVVKETPVVLDLGNFAAYDPQPVDRAALTSRSASTVDARGRTCRKTDSARRGGGRTVARMACLGR